MTRALILALALALGGCSMQGAVTRAGTPDAPPPATQTDTAVTPRADAGETPDAGEPVAAPDLSTSPDAAQPVPDLATSPDLAPDCGGYMQGCCYHLEALDAGGEHTVGTCQLDWVCRVAGAVYVCEQ